MPWNLLPAVAAPLTRPSYIPVEKTASTWTSSILRTWHQRLLQGLEVSCRAVCSFWWILHQCNNFLSKVDNKVPCV